MMKYCFRYRKQSFYPTVLSVKYKRLSLLRLRMICILHAFWINSFDVIFPATIIYRTVKEDKQKNCQGIKIFVVQYTL